MGYCMDQQDHNFFIPIKSKQACLEHALRKLKFRRKSWWVKGEISADTLEELFEIFRWEIQSNEHGDVSDIFFNGEKSGYGEDLEFFQAVAPYVKEGSYIEMHGEDGSLWRWIFDGKTCEEKWAEISWE